MGYCDFFPTSPICVIKKGADGVEEGAKAVGKAVEFAKDPLGYIAQKMQEAAAGLADTVLPELEKLTHPDLSLDWFLSAYMVSFALAMFVFVGFIGWNFVQQARRRVSGDEVMETLAFYTPMFFGGVILGPMLGQLLLQLTGALADSLISWGVGGSVGGTTKALQAAIAAGEDTKIAGGTIVAIIVFFCLIIALLMTFVVLLVMLVTLYLTGVLIPLSLVWLVHPRQRSKGLRLVMVWVGICFSHVLLFLLLGVAFRMVGGLATDFDKPGLTILANLAVAVIALLTATLSPFGLLAFAPVGPSAGGSGPALSLPSMSRSGGGSNFAESDSDSQAAQLARSNEPADEGTSSADSGSNGGGPGGGGAAASEGSSGSRPAGLMGMLAAARSGLGGASPSSGEVATTAGAESAPTAEGGGVAGTAAAGDTSSAGLAKQGTAAGDGSSALSAAGEKATGGGGDLAAAGTAAEATGVGAPVGAALQAAGTVLGAVGSAVSSTAQLAQSAGQMAADHMDHGDNYEGGSSADSRPGR